MYTTLVRLTNKSADLGVLFLIRAGLLLVKGKGWRKEKRWKLSSSRQLSVGFLLGVGRRRERGWEHQHLGMHEC